MTEYIYDLAWEKERERLRGLEEQMDPGTIAALEATGISEGWTCLEVGGGGGSIAGWLCDVVGTQGRVVATDLDTRFLDAIERENLTVMRHDIVADPPVGGGFDVVHSRAMLAHIPERSKAVANMAASVRPGGWLVIEDVDFSTIGTADDHEPSRRLFDGITTMMRTIGVDPYCGRRLAMMLQAAGMADVVAAGRVQVVHGAPTIGILTLESLGPRAVAGGFATQEDLDASIAVLQKGDRDLISPVMFLAKGRKPSA